MSYFIDKENIIDHKGAKEAIAEVKAALGGLKDEITAIKDLTKVLKENNTTLNGLANANKKVTETDSNVIEIKKRLKESIVAYAKEVEKAAKENEKYYAKLEKESKAAAQAAAKAAQTTRNTLKTTRTERMQLILAMNSEKGSATQLAAVNKVLESRMKQLNPLIAEQKIQYDKLNLAVINNSKMMAKHRADMRATGSGFNGLQFQVTQLARELPALAYGPQMFIAAISNNFPMLQDEIKKAKLELVDLKKKGLETVPVWKQMAKAIFSWQSAVIVLMTVYMMFNKEINNFIATLFNYNKKINETKIIHEKLNDAIYEGNKQSQNEISKLEALYTIATDVNRSKEDQYDAIDKLQEIFPDYFKNIDDEIIKNGQALDVYIKLREELKKQAMSRAMLSTVISNNEKIIELRFKESEKAIKSYSKSFMAYTLLFGEAVGAKLATKSVGNRVDEINKEIIALEKANDELIKMMDISAFDEDKKTKGNEFTDLERAKIENAIKLSKLEGEYARNKEAQYKIDIKTMGDTERFRAKMNLIERLSDISMLEHKKTLNDNLLSIANLTEEEIANIKKESASIQSEIDIKIAEDGIKTHQELNEVILSESKQASDAFVNQMYYRADVAKKTAAQSTLTSIREEKKKKREIEKLKRELALYEIRIEIEAAKAIIESVYTTEEEKGKQLSRLEQLYADFYKKQIDNEDQNNDDLEKGFSEWARAVADIYTELFNIINSLYERQLQAAENVYKSESKYAGESVEQRIQAEDKYDKKQREIKRKQAAAQKLQSAFNVILGSYEYVVKALAGDPIAIAQVIASGLALTAIAAEPIPAFAKGGSHKEGMARVSEKGSELFIDKKGKMYLTPDKETVAHFPSGEFIPHDETQRMLANFAMRNDREIVDMTNTNRYLRNIDKNTRNQQTIDFIGGYKIIKRNGITSKIRI